MTPPWSDAFSIKLLFLILQQLPKDSQTGINLRAAPAGAVVQILAAAAAQALTVRAAQQLGIHIQHECSRQDLVQIGLVPLLQEESPLVCLILPLKRTGEHSRKNSAAQRSQTA